MIKEKKLASDREIINKKLNIFDEVINSFHGLLTNVDAKTERIKYTIKKYKQFKVD